MVFINTWVYSKNDTRHVHTGWWSLVNSWREGSCETLYNVLMNIKQMAICLTAGRSGWLGRDGDRCINVIPRHIRHELLSKSYVSHAPLLLLREHLESQPWDASSHSTVFASSELSLRTIETNSCQSRKNQWSLLRIRHLAALTDLSSLSSK